MINNTNFLKLNMTSIKDQKFIYHLTDIDNLPSILSSGLQPRSNLTSFIDVADHEIIGSREKANLQNYVPFHFFARSPFDGAVQQSNPAKIFILIAIHRSLAEANNWSIIPKHPLSLAKVELLDYTDGIAAIDWDAMDKRDYSDNHSRNVCMAECLSPTVVSAHSFFSIYVKDQESAIRVTEMLQAKSIDCHVNINPKMFV